MLTCFDVDGTLIRSFLDDRPCDTCRGSRVVDVAPNVPVPINPREPERQGRELPCPDCVMPYEYVELLPHRAGALWRLARPMKQTRPAFALITNQAGVAFGYQTKLQVGEKMARVLLACEMFFSTPVSVHIAYGHERATIPEYRAPEEVARRKPNPLMLEEAMRVHGAHRDDTVFVGDMDSDRECARRAGVSYFNADEFFV